MSGWDKSFKGIIEIVKCSEEYNRINSPDEITERIIKKSFRLGMKQGALEELKKLKNIGFKSKDSLGLILEFEKYVHKRIEELECGGKTL